MEVYLITFLTMSVFGFGLSMTRQSWAAIPFLLFLLWFMGWRFNVGCDFFGYLSRYDNVFPWTSPFTYLDKREAGFEFLTAFLKVNGYSYLWLNVAASLIMLACYFRYFRVSQQPLAELALLFPVIILQLSMSGLRQGIAVAMLTAACAEFIKGRRLGTAIWIILAAQFHTSAAIFLPLALMAGRSISLKRLIAAVAILAPLAMYLMGEGFEDYTDQYVRQIHGETSSRGALPRYLLILLPSLFFWKFRDAFAEKMPKWQPLFQAFSLGVFFIAPLFLVSSLIVHRLSFYFMPVSIMIAANAYRVVKSDPQKSLVKIAPFLVYGVYLAAWLQFSQHAGRCYLPYNNYTFL